MVQKRRIPLECRQELFQSEDYTLDPSLSQRWTWGVLIILNINIIIDCFYHADCGVKGLEKHQNEQGV